MTVFVVDTNVAIAANGRNTHADDACRLACIKMLRTLVDRETVAVDDRGRIVEEYRPYLRWSGPPGVGDIFFKHVFDHQYRDRRVRRVALTDAADERRGFAELPPNDFDPSDRKFLAVAVAAGAVVLNATDSDWAEHRTLTDELGITVRQLCPQHSMKER